MTLIHIISDDFGGSLSLINKHILDELAKGLPTMSFTKEDPQAVLRPRQVLLREALEITSNDRNKAYGNPEDNFQNIADRWNLYLKCKFPRSTLPLLSNLDVALMMADMKLARLSTNENHRDSLVDLAGYAACAADCQVIPPIAATIFNPAQQQIQKS